MLESGPLGSAACARVTALIREAGERCTRGGTPLTKRVAEPIGFSIAPILAQERQLLWLLLRLRDLRLFLKSTCLDCICFELPTH
jgi:hypothetical protein